MRLFRDEIGAEQAAEIMKRGDVCAIPTDTIYGFSGLAGGKLDSAAKIRALKGRDEDKPFIQLVSDPSYIVKSSIDIISNDILRLLPGALTLIVRTSVSETTAFRCPADSWLRSVIERCGSPIYSTSVNKSGFPAISTAEEIERAFPTLPLVIDGGDLSLGVPSTIVKILPNGDFRVIRQGAVRI